MSVLSMEEEIERRVKQVEINNKIDQVAIIAGQTLTDVREIHQALYGKEGHEGFIGKTTTALTVQKKSTSLLWKSFWVILCSILGIAFFTIKTNLPT